METKQTHEDLAPFVVFCRTASRSIWSSVPCRVIRGQKFWPDSRPFAV